MTDLVKLDDNPPRKDGRKFFVDVVELLLVKLFLLEQGDKL